MVTVSGLSMVGVIGVNRRIFHYAGSRRYQRVYGGTELVGNQYFYLYDTCPCPTKPANCSTANLPQEIADGAMEPRCVFPMDWPSVAGSGRTPEQRSGYCRPPSVPVAPLAATASASSAVAMGGKELNLSFVVERSQLRKTLNVLHDSFFLSEHEDLNLFICGTGTVGASLMQQIAAQREQLLREKGMKLNIVGISGRSRAAYNREGIDPAHYTEAMQQGGEGGVERMMREIAEMNIFNSVFVDCTASQGSSRPLRRFAPPQCQHRSGQ